MNIAPPSNDPAYTGSIPAPKNPVVGDILVYLGGAWTRYPAGTSNYVLTAHGVGVAPTWTALPASTTVHSSLSNLAWNLSGHTGTAGTLAGFAGGGGASYISIGVSSGTVAAGDDARFPTNSEKTFLALLAGDYFVRATVACPSVSGGATDAALSIQLYKLDGTTAVSSVRQFKLMHGQQQYGGVGPPNASLTFSSVTAGSIVAIGNGQFLVTTNASGLFACKAVNADDETVYFAAYSADGGVSNVAQSCVVVGSNSVGTTWS